MTFRAIFTAVIVASALLLVVLMVNSRRPEIEVAQPTVDLVRASGKCAECHSRETHAIVFEYSLSGHAKAKVNCLECHQALPGQQKMEHRGFIIANRLTSKNCSQCHAQQYDQFLRSRHAAPAWAAVKGPDDFTAEQILFAEKYHKGAVKRPANKLAALEGGPAIEVGCAKCHNIGKPNLDGSIGTCTACHARHASSVELARLPQTCGQCHMGPDHSQIEIYNESKHGVLFNQQRGIMDLKAKPGTLTTNDMPVPTCATCHMSGLNGLKSTHDTSERLSYWLFAPVSEKRPNYTLAQANMQDVCKQCHTAPYVERFYQEAESVVDATNVKIGKARDQMLKLKADGLLEHAPFSQEIDFVYFDMWHYFGRTAKHGAFMGGADFVQWHGNYELLHSQVMLDELAKKLEEEHEK
ncbi:Hydroxylamine oxidoreductase precursor [Poriferisphaera corsica]|uniref:Hydroxylamine oxidoreductase n=1 Tax=Poriferisphaera corsica TaxID=2528020 RepID=A0A517YXA2_9BACT|nr:multiheme c-type cytochrome [Poriferisphaera corsica]QDU34849.1 Hydroxylamine oxidoreductase precursor [Poriferisphaera corsica]